MKMKLRYFLVLLLSLIISTSQANSLTSHIPFFPSKKTIVKGVVAGAVIGGLSYYIYTQLSKFIENTIKKNDDGKISDWETSNLIAKEINKILNNPKKTDQQKSQSVVEAQQLLLYYAIAYYEPNGNDLYDIAIRTAKKANIYTDDFDYELQQGIRMTSEIMRHMLSVASEIDIEDTRTQKNVCDINDPARVHIYNPYILFDKVATNINRPVFEFDYGSYKDLNAVAAKYLKETKDKRTKIRDNFDHDHIPAKGALKLYLENRDKYLYKFNDKIRTTIENNGSVIAIDKVVHEAGRTSKNRAKSTMKRDSQDLKKATLKDFKMHYYYYKKNGTTNPSFETLFAKAFRGTYNKNKKMCLYVKK
jgi:hypothetical protein